MGITRPRGADKRLARYRVRGWQLVGRIGFGPGGVARKVEDQSKAAMETKGVLGEAAVFRVKRDGYAEACPGNESWADSITELLEELGIPGGLDSE